MGAVGNCCGSGTSFQGEAVGNHTRVVRMKKGLDKSGRSEILRLVADKASGERVREAIKNRVRSTDFDMEENVRLLDDMRRKGYNDSAAFLVRYLEG